MGRADVRQGKDLEQGQGEKEEEEGRRREQDGRQGKEEPRHEEDGAGGAGQAAVGSGHELKIRKAGAPGKSIVFSRKPFRSSSRRFPRVRP